MVKKPSLIFTGVVTAALVCSCLAMPQAGAGQIVVPFMPAPGVMVNLSPAYTPAFLRGIVVHPDNALRFDFIVERGEGGLSAEQKRAEYGKLIKYFLASLAVPDKDQWVNLSPYEKGRIIENDFGRTEMGRDLLRQDYLLKQITSSLIYPERQPGKKFWDAVYARAYKEYGRTDIPVDTFNKVWIVPDKAVIYEKSNTAYVLQSHLNVMLEEDYVSLARHSASAAAGRATALHALTSDVVRRVILPELEKEVNEGGNFAGLRQVYSGMLLAAWYKRALKGSLLGRIYADQNKMAGLALPRGGQAVEAVYQKYLQAFKKGVFNYIKEDTGAYARQPAPRKYFSGGTVGPGMVFERAVIVEHEPRTAAERESLAAGVNRADKAAVSLTPAKGQISRSDAAMTVGEFIEEQKLPQRPSVRENLIAEGIWNMPLDEFKEKSDEDLLTFSASSQVSGLDGEFLDQIKMAMIRKREFLPSKVSVRQAAMAMGLRTMIQTIFQRAHLWEAPLTVLLEKTEEDVLRLDDFGPLSLNELKEGLENIGLALKSPAKAPAPSSVIYVTKFLARERSSFSPDAYRVIFDYVAYAGLQTLDELSQMTAAEIQKTSRPGGGMNPEVIGQLSAVLAKHGRALRSRPVPRASETLRRSVVYKALEKLVEDIRDLAPGSNERNTQRVIRVKRQLSEIEEAIQRHMRNLVLTFNNKTPPDSLRFTINPREGKTFLQRVREIAGRLDPAPEVISSSRIVFSLPGKPDPAMGAAGRKPADKAQMSDLGGIDMNAANVDLQIKRDGKGVPLPLAEQDMAQLAQIRGFEPQILEIRPAAGALDPI